MSAYIGYVNGPDSNSPEKAVELWSSTGGVELTVFEHARIIEKTLDPIAARNLAGLLVRAAEEVELMRAHEHPPGGRHAEKKEKA